MNTQTMKKKKKKNLNNVYVSIDTYLIKRFNECNLGLDGFHKTINIDAENNIRDGQKNKSFEYIITCRISNMWIEPLIEPRCC